MSNDGFKIDPEAEGTEFVEVVPNYERIRAENRAFLTHLIVCLEDSPDLALRLRQALANAGGYDGTPA